MPETGLLARYKIFLLFYLFTSLSLPQSYPDKEVDNMLKRGIEEIISENYHKADSIFNLLDRNYSHLPLGKIYLAAAMIAKNFDYGEEYNSEYIISYLESAMQQSEKLRENNEDNIWNIYFAALSRGYYAYYEALNGSMISSFTNGISSISLFKECLDKDKNFYEAYTALGAYKYWKSAKLKFLNWLPFVEDEREVGIRYLEKAVTTFSYNQYLAANSLIWIYIDQQRYNDAVNLSHRLLKIYPGSRFFKWGQARAYENLDKKKSIEVYKEILYSYEGIIRNSYNEILLKHKIAQQHAKLGEKESAKKMCEEILKQSENISPKIKEKLGDRLNRVRKLLKTLD